MKKIFTKETIIGLTVIVSLLVLFFGIDYLKGINVFKAANYYYVSYTNVAGLAQSAPVTVNGFKVGVVREIQYEYNNPGHISVELSLDKNLKVPVGTKAVIVTDMLGTATIELKMAAAGETHAVGDKLIGENQAGLMDAVSGELMPTIMQIAPRIDSLLIAANNIAANPALMSSISRLDNIMANLESSTAQLDKAMGAVPAIVGNVNTSMANVSEMSANLKQISAALAVLSEDLKSAPIDSTLRNLNEITANLDLATAQLNSTNSSLGMLLNDAALYNNLNNTAAHLDSILIDLKRQPKRYIPAIKVF